MDEQKPQVVNGYRNGKFFSETRMKTEGNKQVTTVTVNIDQKDDCMSSCFKAFLSCFKR
jgi:hypothetical protein